MATMQLPAATRERPILFSALMVRALLAGEKTQTRRALKVQPLDVMPGKGEQRGRVWYSLTQRDPNRGGVFTCRYGAPGDRLWVREAWQAELEWPADLGDPRLHWWHEVPAGWRGAKNAQRVYYAADRSEYEVRDMGEGEYDLTFNSALDADDADDSIRWRPSIHMPRWASRLVLELTDVRVERVQAMAAREEQGDASDALAEGIVCEPDRVGPCYGLPGAMTNRTAYAAFARLWDSLNAPRGFGWDANPWVWVLTFRPTQPATAPDARAGRPGGEG